MNGEDMILQCINKMIELGHSVYDSTMMVVCFLASRAGVPYACTTKLTKEEYDYLNTYCDYKILVGNSIDYFTPILESIGLISTLQQGKIEEIIDTLNNKQIDNHEPQLILTLPHHTTQLMVTAFNRFGSGHIYVVTEPDLLEYRINLLTAKLNNIPAIMLNASPELYDVSLNSVNWDFANNWDGPVFSRLEVKRCQEK